MTFATCFWVLMLLWLVLGLWNNWVAGPRAVGWCLLEFLLFLLIGWKLFGSPLHGG